MATARSIIEGSLRLIGAISGGETASASEIADGLVTLNDLLDSWSNENLLVFATIREALTLVAAQQTYTMGTGGNFNTARPIKVVKAGILDNSVSPPTETPIDVITVDDWASVAQKTLTSTNPTKVYNDNSYPLTNIIVWPVPTAGNQIVLYSEKQIISFSTASDTVQLPPGYSKALKYNLAIDLCPEYGKEPTAAMIKGASDGVKVIKRRNKRPVISETGITKRSSYNILTGDWI